MLGDGQFPVTLEITPPRKPLTRVLLRRARLLGDAADAINVIHRADRQSSLDASLALIANGIEPVWHLAVRGRSRDQIAASIARARDGGIRQVLCVRGDQPEGNADGPTIREAAAMVADAIPGALVGATLNQYRASPRAIRNLAGKLEAGAGYVQTQPVFDVPVFAAAAERVLDVAPAVKLVPMVMPLLSLEAIDRIEQRLDIPFPAGFRRRIASGQTAAWEAFAELVADLRATGLAHGLAVMTFATDPPPEDGARIVAALQAAVT
ncbi:MAG: hypothetical protein Kow0010_04520 [Dehalococcoidia bacterium]